MYHLMLELHQKYVSCLGIKKRGVHINAGQTIPLNCKVTVEGSKESSSTDCILVISVALKFTLDLKRKIIKTEP